MSASGFAARAQSAGDRNANAGGSSGGSNASGGNGAHGGGQSGVPAGGNKK